MHLVLAARPPSVALGSPPPLLPPRARGLPLLPPRSHGSHRSRPVAARDRKLTGQSTETIPHDGGGGGSYSNRQGGGSGGGGGGGNGSDDSGSSEGPEEPNPRRALLLATLKWLAAGALAAAALVAALPTLLSHPAGLKLVLAAINLASPLALTVHLDSAQLGWQQPLMLSGLRLVERGGGSGDGDSSSDDEEPLPVPQPDSSAAGSSSGGGSSSGQPSGRLRVLRRQGASAAQPAATAEQAAAEDGTAAGGSVRRRRTLVSVDRVSTTCTLLQLLRGGSAVDCVVSKPQIDCTLNAAGTPRLLAALQQAKVVPQAYPAPAQQAAGTAAVAALAVPSTTALAGQPGGQSSGSGDGSSKGSGSSSGKEQPAARQASAAAAAAAAAAAGLSKQRQRHDDSSDSEAEEPAMPVHSAAGQRGSGADVQSVSPAALLGYMMPAQGLKRSSEARQPQRSQQDVQPPAQQAGGSGGRQASAGGAAGGDGSRSWLPDSLQVASSAVKVTGEVNTGKVSLCVSDGALLVPSEVRELLGKHLHFEVLQGASAIEEAAADEQPAAPASPSAGAAGTAAASTAAGAASKRPAAARWARQRPAVLLPWGTGMPQMPVQLRLDGELMQFSLQGWQTTKGFTYLRRPVEARMRFTPALSKYLLTHLHPLLGGTVGMKGATVVEARLIPHDGLLPTSQATVRIEPLSVEIGESPVLRSTVGVLGEVVKKLKLSAGARAELSPLQATLCSDGRLTAERLDVRIKTGLGPWSQGLHLVSWGTASLRPPQSLDATLAVPGDALTYLGLPALPEGTGLPLHIGGTPTKPEVEVGRASKQLALLVAKQQAAKLGGGKGGAIQFLVDQVQQIGGAPESIGVPLPPPLPPTVK